MHTVDWLIVIGYALVALAIGSYFARRASGGVESYFVGGRSLPWWVIGFSSVASYSSAGTASAITMLVFTGGLLGNWWWWTPWVIWMPLVAVLWSKFWRRMRVVSTAEFIELRYGGRAASIFRSIAAMYFSFGWAVVLMAYVTGWLIKAVGPILGWSNLKIIVFAATLAFLYTMMGGLLGAAYSDIFQFCVFFLANLIFVPVVIRAVGGMGTIYTKIAAGFDASFFRAAPPGGEFSKLTILALVLQGLFFAASPTAGEGFTAQRFMAAKNEFHAQVGQLVNAMFSLVIRVIPFLFLGMAGAAFYGRTANGETLWGNLVGQFSFPGLTGLLVAAELAAYQGTISTEMNWGASFLINDLYKRVLIKKRPERHYVLAGRIATLLLLTLALLLAYFRVKEMLSWFLFINNVMIAFILPLAWLRFMWWRLNIWGEIAALAGGLPLSYVVWFVLDFAHRPFWHGFLLLFGGGWTVILLTTLLTPAESREVLTEFYRRCKPIGFWGPVTRTLTEEDRQRVRMEMRSDLLNCFLGISFCTSAVTLTTSLFGRHWAQAFVCALIGMTAFFFFARSWWRRGVFHALKEGENGQSSLRLVTESRPPAPMELD
jgi:solute:Na+ symporter, SSS family